MSFFPLSLHPLPVLQADSSEMKGQGDKEPITPRMNEIECVLKRFFKPTELEMTLDELAKAFAEAIHLTALG